MSIAAFAIAQTALSQVRADVTKVTTPAQRIVAAIADPKPRPEPR